MIGGQVLIIFVGNEAFKITPLNGKEWGLSVGLGALSLPIGASELIELFILVTVAPRCIRTR